VTSAYSSTPQQLPPGCKQSTKTTGPQRGNILTSDGGTQFDSAAFLANAGQGRTVIDLKPQGVFFCQGDPAQSVFYLQDGRARVTVVSQGGMEATITLLSAGEFVGENSLASVDTLHLSTATAITACRALKIERKEMLRAMHEEWALSELFIKYLLARAKRTESDLLDQLFNSSEKRFARILLLMAEFGEPDQFAGLIPEITEESLAQMIGAPRSSVSFFMKHFHELGLINYDGRIRVNRALLNAILHDQLPSDNAAKPPITNVPRKESKPVKRTPSHSRPRA
jgi:CRP/FNR family transcriptional regulator, cyclic AMP receptor protein